MLLQFKEPLIIGWIYSKDVKLLLLQYIPPFIFCVIFFNDVNSLKLQLKTSLISLKGNLKEVLGTFDCTDCPKLINPKQQIIEHQIKAEKYQTDKGDFSFNDIKKEYEEYGRKLENSLKLKSSINNNEFGLSI